MTYAELAASFRTSPREVPTAPINGKAPKWFYVYERRGEIFVASGREHPDVCNICPERKLQRGEFSVMLELYLRRKRGEPVSREASRQSINQSYWFGIFKEMSV